AVDARWIQSTRSCRQRYVCDHSCDPGAGHACICQRGYRPAGPEDRSRLIGYGSGAADGIKGQGRVCLDVDECEDAAVRAQCTQRGGVCTNRPGDHQCLCPSGLTQFFVTVKREFLSAVEMSRVSLGILSLAICALLAVCQPTSDTRTGEDLPTREHECYLSAQDMEVARMRIFEGIKGVFTTIRKCKDRGTPMAECELAAFGKVDSTDDRDYSDRRVGVGEFRPQIHIIDSRHGKYPRRRFEPSAAMLEYRTDQPYILRPYPFPVGESPSHFNSRPQRPTEPSSSSERIAEQPVVHRPMWADVNPHSREAIPPQSNPEESYETPFPKIIGARSTFRFPKLYNADPHSEESGVESDSTEECHDAHHREHGLYSDNHEEHHVLGHTGPGHHGE
ncbi:Hemicentin-1, partial [Taenia solium]